MDARTTLASEYDLDFAEWASWRNREFGVRRKTMESSYRAELARCGATLRPGTRVLEIGFGGGEFMAYALANGADISGIEADADWVELAKSAGYDAHLQLDVSLFQDASFDLVVAIDVLEHIPTEDMADFLFGIRRVLRPGGMFLARFPNADSPFGLRNQHGNVTHVNAIGSEKASYYARQVGAHSISVSGELKPILCGHFKHMVQRAFAAPLKWLTNLVVRTVFLPGYRLDFCAVNLVLTFRV